MVNPSDSTTSDTQNSLASSANAGLKVLDASGNPISFNKVVLELASTRDEALIQLRDIAALRATEPARG